jgi:hypothetical protein
VRVVGTVSERAELRPDLVHLVEEVCLVCLGEEPVQLLNKPNPPNKPDKPILP